MSRLDPILAATRARVAAAERQTPPSALRDHPPFHAPTRSFGPALKRAAAPAVIAECKRASPSAGRLRADYDPAALARAYQVAGAAAVSVLTEPEFFGGSLGHLAAVRAAVALPVLRKDFVLDPYQLVEARAAGADAVLLIAAALAPRRLHDLHDEARSLGLGVLVEVHTEAEAEALDLDRLEVVGVNSRDLSTFDVDLDRAGRVLAGLPPALVRVAESGLREAGDLARLRRRGADAFLIGTRFMRAAAPGDALAALRRETAALLHPMPAEASP